MSIRDNATIDFSKEEVYIEHFTNNGKGTTHRRRVPTTLPIPADTIDPRDLDTAVLVVTYVHLIRHSKTLNALDVRPIQRVKYLGGGNSVEPGLAWTYGCETGFQNLKSIEFCGIDNVREVPENFLLRCSKLESIDLSPFSRVTSLGTSFLYGCSSLTSIDLTPVSNVTDVGSCFMLECVGLTTIDLAPLSKVKSVGVSFMSQCTSLRSIDNLASIFKNCNTKATPDQFLCGCTSLTSADFGDELFNITSILPFFMYNCTSLTTINLAAFGKVTILGQMFLCGCSSLTAIDLTPLSNVTDVGSNFMNQCTSLRTLDLAPFSNVTTIGDCFMMGCTSLTNVDLTPLMSNVKKVGKSFFIQCNALTPETLKEFEQALKDNKKRNNKVATPSAARKVAVKAAGKKKK